MDAIRLPYRGGRSSISGGQCVSTEELDSKRKSIFKQRLITHYEKLQSLMFSVAYQNVFFSFSKWIKRGRALAEDHHSPRSSSSSSEAAAWSVQRVKCFSASPTRRNLWPCCKMRQPQQLKRLKELKRGEVGGWGITTTLYTAKTRIYYAVHDNYILFLSSYSAWTNLI